MLSLSSYFKGSTRITASMTFDVEEVLGQLTLEEKVSLLSGTDFWHTASIPRLNVPSIRVSDGPNGVRGTRFFNGLPAACFPCGTALAATWDMDLIQKGGALQGAEAIEKGASVILGPTCNMQRSPLGGRGFESFSEDPVLAGKMSAATIQGIQSKGVAATIKHFVCNDSEDNRMGVNAIVSQRALREIYLVPFQIAQRDANPWCYMTAYNRVNGAHVSENKFLLQNILRDEWKFDGMVMSDWTGVYSTTGAIKAGLNLEMPGPSYIRGKLVTQALRCGNLTVKNIDDCVREVLKLVKKVLPLGIPEHAPERNADTPETSKLLRTIAASSVVLMKNEKNILPFKKDKSIAVIGPNAKFAAYCGGGSAALRPYYARTPFEGITAQAKDVRYAIGAIGYRKLPHLTSITKSEGGKRGLTMKVYLDPPSDSKRREIDEVHIESSELILLDYSHPKLTSNLFYIDLVGTLTPEESGDYSFSLSVLGTAKLFINGEMCVDNTTNQKPGDSFFGAGTIEEYGTCNLKTDKTYDVLVQFGSAPTSSMFVPGASGLGGGGVRVGGAPIIDVKTAMEKAVKLAKEVDQVVICAGLNSDWESEGYDRPNMDLPPNSDALIAAVTAANPNTAVVIQSGTPVTMPWLSSAPALLQAWYGGNETGNAIADVLFGDVNPGGKLSLTFPVTNEDNPAFLNSRSERGRTWYGEDVYVGYRFYEKTGKPVNFPFGHGLSYTKFDMNDLKVTEKGEDVIASVEVSNTGSVDGAQVVQVYVSQKSPSLNRPVKELKGFSKVFLKASQSKTVEVPISKKYAASFWDEERDMWIMEKDTFTVLVGDSSANTPLTGEFEVSETRWWKGL